MYGLGRMIVALLIVASLVAIICVHPALASEDSTEPVRRRLGLGIFTDPRTSEVRVPDGLVETDEMEKFSYIFMHYHKTGHDLSNRVLRAMTAVSGIEENTSTRHVLKMRQHNEVTKCPGGTNVEEGVAYESRSPDLFCDLDALLGQLLSHRDHSRVKILHMVRNPFTLAIR